MTSNYRVLESQVKGDDVDNGYDDLGVYVRPARKTVHKVIIWLLSVFLILAIGLIVAFAVLYGRGRSQSDSSSSSDVCQSDACFALSVQIKGAMDERADPCEDFYNFTCGNWNFYNHIGQGMAGYDALTVQQYDVYDRLADVLETQFNTAGNQILTELQDFYDSCIVAHTSDNQLDVQPFRKLYQELGGWSVVNIPGDGTQWGINSTQFIREKTWGSKAFYSLSIGINDAVTEFTLAIKQSGLTLEHPSLYNNSSSTDKMLQQIIGILTFLAQKNDSTAEIRDAASDIVQFETILSQIWEDPPLDDNSINSTMTVNDLFQLWPYHDWWTVLGGVFSPAGVVIQPSSPVTVVTPEYFRCLSSLVSSTPDHILENYAKWQPTWQLAQIFAADDTIRESMIHFKEVVMGKPSLEQRQECVSQVEDIMPIALGRVYAQHILPSGYKEAGMELVSEVREGLRQRMMEVDWLDDKTRKLAIEKLEAIESRVAYPTRTFDDDYLESLYGEYKFDKESYVVNYLNSINISQRQEHSLLYQPVDRTMWFDAPTTVNAYYSPPFNQITILEAIMQLPIFNKDWPLSVQYGALGMVLGHELTHGFDNEGRQYDKDGRKRMWWTERAVQTFNNRSQCFVDQYSQYEMFGIPVNGSMTLGENIADNGGIRASYNAYNKVSQDSQRLPGLTDYTNDQLFFIAFGQLWCSYTTESSLFLQVLTNEHSPDIFRVLGTLMNNEDFATAFECPLGSPMNPKDKCVLW